MDNFLHLKWRQHVGFQCGFQCCVSTVYSVSAISQSRHAESRKAKQVVKDFSFCQKCGGICINTLIIPCVTHETSYRAKHCNYVYHASQPGASVTSWLGPTWESPAVTLENRCGTSEWSIGRGVLTKAVISCACFLTQKKKNSVIASVTEFCEDGITETHKQLNHIHRTWGRRTSSFSLFPLLPICVSHFHLLACINKAMHTYTHTHTHRFLTSVCTRLNSKVYQHQACCHVKFSTLSTDSPFTLLNCSGLLWKWLLMSKTIQKLAQTAWHNSTNPYNIHQQKLSQLFLY